MTTYDQLVERSGLVTGGLIPTKYVPGIIQEAVTASACLPLMRRLPNMSTKVESRPVMNDFPDAYFVDTEAGDASGNTYSEGLLQTTDQGWTNTTLTASKLGVTVWIPKDTIDDAISNGYDLWGEIKPRIGEAIAKKIDAASLHGTDKPTAWPDGIVTGAGTYGTTLEHGSDADLKDWYDEIFSEGGIFSLVEGKRYRINGIMADVSMLAALRGLRATDGTPLYNPSMQEAVSDRLAGLPLMVPENGCLDATAALMIVGDWSKALYAWRQDMLVSFSDTAIGTNASGTVIRNAFQQDLIAMKVTCRLGWCMPIPANRAGTTNRYPFGVLTPAA